MLVKKRFKPDQALLKLCVLLAVEFDCDLALPGKGEQPALCPVTHHGHRDIGFVGATGKQKEGRQTRQNRTEETVLHSGSDRR